MSTRRGFLPALLLATACGGARGIVERTLAGHVRTAAGHEAGAGNQVACALAARAA
jgi:hypothetical protein